MADTSKLTDQIIRNYKRNELLGIDEAIHIDPDNGAHRGVSILVDDMDQLASDMCDELIKTTLEQINYTTYKAVTFKCLDNALYITSHLISLTILILGLYKGSTSGSADTSTSSNSTYFFVTGVLGGVNGVLVELSKRYNFMMRSTVIYGCAMDYNSIVVELRELKVSPLPPDQKMVRVKDIESSIRNVRVKAFGSHVIKTSIPT